VEDVRVEGTHRSQHPLPIARAHHLAGLEQAVVDVEHAQDHVRSGFREGRSSQIPTPRAPNVPIAASGHIAMGVNGQLYLFSP
jgi:hypothetical protein